MLSCNVIRDLIPLVNDDVASEESKIIVKGHCEGCSECRDLLTSKPSCGPKDEKIIRTLKNSVLATQLAIVSIGILLGVWFTGSYNAFHNFYIMPFVGGLAYFALGKKSLYVPLSVFVMTELLQVLRAIPYLNIGQLLDLLGLGVILYSALLYAVLYALLSTVGIIVSFLLTYAFRRDRS